MTNSEFSDTFTTLLNSFYTQAQFGEQDSKQGIVLDEYEKSVFLTQAQEDVILSLYNGKNVYGESFENTEELRRYLSYLVREANLSPIITSGGLPLGMESNSKFFTLPSDLWFITYESVIASKGRCGNVKMEVVPIKQDEYHKVKKNPFRGANNRRALRLDLSDGVIEIVSKYNVVSYYLRYLRTLKPIVLINLTDGLSINGVSTATECEAHESLHQKILERAVIMALQSKGYNYNNANK